MHWLSGSVQLEIFDFGLLDRELSQSRLQSTVVSGQKNAFFTKGNSL